MDCSAADFLVLHHLLELAQTHIHQVADAIQPSHPLPPASPRPAHFSSCSQSFPASGSFPVSWLFASGRQSIGTSSSVLPMTCSWLISFWIDWFYLAVQGTLESSPVPRINSSVLSLLYGPTLTSLHDYWKNHTFDYTDLRHISFQIHINLF